MGEKRENYLSSRFFLWRYLWSNIFSLFFREVILVRGKKLMIQGKKINDPLDILFLLQRKEINFQEFWWK